MISLHRLSDSSSIAQLKVQYLQSLVAPMDGMWEMGFIDPAPHWEIRVDGEQTGYYAANDKGTLLQFFVGSGFELHGRALFDRVIAEESLTQATVATLDPTYLSFCLDVQKEVTVHTYLYELCAGLPPSHAQTEGPALRRVEASQLDRTIAFQQACLGGDKNLNAWLRGYSANLIERKELFVLAQGGDWLGLGEHRRSNSQEGVSDLGMMVAPGHRRHGWATYILTLLRAQCTAEGRRAICSTTVENVGAQKAIKGAGFVSRHRILNVTF